MASFTPNDNTLSNAPHPDDIDIAPRICGYCNEYLAITDKAKSSGRYWKGCKRCLDERAAKEQKRIIFKRAKAELNIDIATRHGGRCSYDFRTDDEQDNEETFFIKQETSSALDPSSFCKYNAGDTSDDTNLETAECTEITDPQTPAYKGCEEHFQDPVDRKKDGNWYVNCITCRNKAKAIRRREKAAYGMCFGQKKNHASQGNIHDEEPGSEDAL
ncbi:hypothetical protein PtrSN002B_009965 [Pyrenophora tritici-repentis]|uniref:Uncharacterized protein n=1 Tax=Pyrenophora tritici-repentis TaxID=45151 RepID=A0A2W1CY18_9PLEO|nr:hypothetical protein PtrM4_084500 [Pyrenophora tritici-repentis]KAI0571169.1 hypothetical protein Alg215_10573 [Pyrenophora tritici-repentis]KAI0586359.1 hypothetical protein Alg130_04308 [Pyrenophora tritici-repentis]KAI0611521.1 hypothetical protein TUN205_04251 [Pyrenophora tritici-repentis]KAI0622960.1 hypothetical protein TUN199_05063 [Pyrenophora tritici-repentis]